MQTISEFLGEHPEYALFVADKPAKKQRRRITDLTVLVGLPEELSSDGLSQPSGRGHVNPNQTLTHRQCTRCFRVLRNDLFYEPESYKKRGLVFSRCLDCCRDRNVGSYAQSDTVKVQKAALWRYLASECAVCGYGASWRAMTLYRPGLASSKLAGLVEQLLAAPSVWKVEQLLKAIEGSVPVCRNCLARLEGLEIELPAGVVRPRWQLVRVVKLMGLGNDVSALTE